MVNPLNLPQAPRVLRIAANTEGRDFIVGDIHGAYNSVLAAMKLANFEGSRDRIFAVGDLMDRGPDSWRCAKFLAHRYVRSIRGNHEDMLLELYAKGVPDEEVLQWAARHNGFGWWLLVPETQRLEILWAIALLPTVIELETPRGTVGLVHADVPAGMDWSTFIKEVEAENPKVLETALWGRDRLQSGNDEGVKGIGRLFVGHTPQWGGLRRLGNVYAVDSGAIFGEMGKKDEGRLTFVDAVCKTGILMAPRPAMLIDVREDLRDEALGTAPFGTYTGTTVGRCPVS